MALALVKLGTLVLLPFEWTASPANPTLRPNSIGLRYRAAGAMQLHSGRVCAVPARFRRNRTRHRGKSMPCHDLRGPRAGEGFAGNLSQIAISLKKFPVASALAVNRRGVPTPIGKLSY